MEECFERSKGNRGVADHAVRSRVGWYRWITPSLFALAVLAVIRSRVGSAPFSRRRGSRGESH